MWAEATETAGKLATGPWTRCRFSCFRFCSTDQILLEVSRCKRVTMATEAKVQSEQVPTSEGTNKTLFTHDGSLSSNRGPLLGWCVTGKPKGNHLESPQF